MMSTQQASCADVSDTRQVLDLTIAQAREARRDDLIQRLSGARRLLVDHPTTAHLAGESQHDINAVAHHILFALDQLEQMLQLRQSRLSSPTRAAHARSALRQAEQQANALQDRMARWQKMLFDSFAAISSDVDFDLRQRTQAVLVEAERTIERGDPGKNWDEFTTRLRQRLAAEAQANHDLTVTASRTVSQRAAQLFTLSDMHIVDPPRVTIPTEPPTPLDADQVFSGKRGGLSAVVNILLRGYIGFVMFYLLTRFIGLDIPLVVGLVPTLLLGGLALIEERNRRLDKRRGQASTALNNYVADFSMQLTKDSRDLLRRLEQELRDAYAARIERMRRKLDEARNIANLTLREDEQSPRLLELIDADLALLADLRRRATASAHSMPTWASNSSQVSTRTSAASRTALVDAG